MFVGVDTRSMLQSLGTAYHETGFLLIREVHVHCVKSCKASYSNRADDRHEMNVMGTHS